MRHSRQSPLPCFLDLAAGRRPVAWLWPGWISRGMATLLAVASPAPVLLPLATYTRGKAQAGTAKSLAALDLARRWALTPHPTRKNLIK